MGGEYCHYCGTVKEGWTGILDHSKSPLCLHMLYHSRHLAATSLVRPKSAALMKN